MNKQVKFVIALGIAVLIGSFALAATRGAPKNTPPKVASPEVLLHKMNGSDTGHALAVLEITGDTAALQSPLAVFRLVFISPENGRLVELQRTLPYSDVVWPVCLKDDSLPGRVISASFAVPAAATSTVSALSEGLTISVSEQ